MKIKCYKQLFGITKETKLDVKSLDQLMNEKDLK